MKPDNATTNKCVTVTSTSTVTSLVKVYATGVTATNGLNSAVNMTVEEGPATASSSSGTCGGTWTGSTQIFSGTVDSFGQTKTNYATGVGSWAPATSGNPTKVYRFGVTMPTTATTGAGLSTSMTLTFEADNT
jgi:phage terminase large subunit-like protein